MLSVIVTPGDSARLAGLLAALTPAAVEGLVREVWIACGGPEDLLHAVCDHTGAEIADDVDAALRAAKGELVLLVPPEFRPKEGWVERLGDHLRAGGGEAVISGLGGGLLRKGPQALLVRRREAAGLASAAMRRRAGARLS